MTLSQALEFPNCKIVFLIEATAGMWCRAWVVDGTLTNTYKISTTLEVTAAKWNLATALTLRASAALVDANAGSWYWDGTVLWVRPPVGQSIFANTVQATVAFYWANHPKIHNNRWYDPRLLSSPGLSKRIEAFFGINPQTGGGSIQLANQDGVYNALLDLQWDAGTCRLLLGADTYDQEMVYADYQAVATWVPDMWTRDEETITFRMVEPKGKLKTKIPFAFFDRTTYPNIDSGWVGKPIPIAYGAVYGVEPVTLDPGAKRFKVTGHAIRDLVEVRLEKSIDENRTLTPASTDWYLYATDTYRYYLPGEEAVNVTIGGVTMTSKANLADCVATASTWCKSDSYVYVHVASGNMSTSVYAIESQKGLTIFKPTSFATKDLANGEFTLGTDWLPGTAVSVDFIGKTDGTGAKIVNTIDILQDLLATVSETSLNSASFATARARLLIGSDENGDSLHVRSVGIYISEALELTEILAEVLKAAQAFLYSDASGQYYVGLFQPTAGESLQLFTEADFLSFEEETDAQEIFSRLSTNYAQRTKDDYAQVSVRTSLDQQYLHGQISPAVSERTVNLPVESDVIYWSDRVIALEGRAVKRYRGAIPWRGIPLSPGDQVQVTLASKAFGKTLEVLETVLDASSKSVQLVLGDLRALGDSAGWWVDSAAALPTRFASLAGYGAGSNVWNKNWHAEIKAWARQNVGYWTDANGFADSTDPDSFMASTWT